MFDDDSPMPRSDCDIEDWGGESKSLSSASPTISITILGEEASLSALGLDTGVPSSSDCDSQSTRRLSSTSASPIINAECWWEGVSQSLLLPD